eukprot:GHVU01102453.1.p2 GENE.GHVU01102453.1~~GHVU01102453.1.p2  ORF type:complete len:927 (+),score=80.83 GHVU01102453.1:5895-8675(+)
MYVIDDDLPILWEYVNECALVDAYDVLTFLCLLQFDSVATATKALIRYMHDYDSPLGTHGVKTNANGDIRVRRVCNIRMLPKCKCTVTVVNRRGNAAGEGSVCIEWNKIKHHHELQHPVRMQRELVELVDQVAQDARAAGLRNLDASNRVGIALAAFGAHKARRDVSGRRRRVEANCLAQVRANEAVPVTVSFEGVEGVDRPVQFDPSNAEKREEFRDVVEALGWVHKEMPNAYINVLHQECIVSYVFISLMGQRTSGTLFGDIRCLDDRHDVSHSYMKLAATAVLTSNGKMNVASCAFMAHSDFSHWKQFVQDTVDALDTVEGGPIRHWEVSLADQDGSISGAVRGLEDGQRPLHIWTCYWHFVRALEKRFRRLEKVWSPIVELLRRMLGTDSQEEFRDLAFDANKLTSALTDADLMETVKLFLQEVSDSRSLSGVDCFTNAYNSQSPVESASHVFKMLGTHSGRKLGDVVRSVVYQMVDQSTKHDHAVRIPDTHPCLATHLPAREHLTTFAFRQKYLPEYDEARNYCARWQQDRQCYSVKAIDYPEAPERIVKLLPSRSCDCNRMVWLGFPCRHIIAASFAATGAWVFDVADVNRRWLRKQPVPQFRLRSPFENGPVSSSSMRGDAPQPMQEPPASSSSSTSGEAPQSQQPQQQLQQSSSSSGLGEAPQSQQPQQQLQQSSSSSGLGGVSQWSQQPQQQLQQSSSSSWLGGVSQWSQQPQQQLQQSSSSSQWEPRGPDRCGSMGAAVVCDIPLQVRVSEHQHARASGLEATNDATHTFTTSVSRMHGNPAMMNAFTEHMNEFTRRQEARCNGSEVRGIGRLPTSQPGRGRPRVGRLKGARRVTKQTGRKRVGSNGKALPTCSYCSEQGHRVNQCKKQLRDLTRRTRLFRNNADEDFDRDGLDDIPEEECMEDVSLHGTSSEGSS